MTGSDMQRWMHTFCLNCFFVVVVVFLFVMGGWENIWRWKGSDHLNETILSGQVLWSFMFYRTMPLAYEIFDFNASFIFMSLITITLEINLPVKDCNQTILVLPKKVNDWLRLWCFFVLRWAANKSNVHSPHGLII